MRLTERMYQLYICSDSFLDVQIGKIHAKELKK